MAMDDLGGHQTASQEGQQQQPQRRHRRPEFRNENNNYKSSFGHTE